jgi:hypothetical protein
MGSYDRHFLMDQQFHKGDIQELTHEEATRFTSMLQQRL